MFFPACTMDRTCADAALSCIVHAGKNVSPPWAQNRLGNAGGWSAWDTFAGGGMLSSMLKHDELDRATEHLDRAAAALQRFSRELADVELPGVLAGQQGVSPACPSPSTRRRRSRRSPR